MMNAYLKRLQLDAVSSDAATARTVARARLRKEGLRLYLGAAALITLVFWVGCLYLLENAFVVVSWSSLQRHAPTAHALLRALFFAIDGAVIVGIGLPLLYGCAVVFHAACHGKRLPLSALLGAFGSRRTYRRAIAVMATVLAPRALVAFAVCLPLQRLATGNGSPLTVVGLVLALHLLALSLPALCLDDAFLPLALGHPDTDLVALYRRSLALTRPRLWRILLFRLSYLGYWVLSILSLGVLFFSHALPYYCLSHTAWTDSTYKIIGINMRPSGQVDTRKDG